MSLKNVVKEAVEKSPTFSVQLQLQSKNYEGDDLDARHCKIMAGSLRRDRAHSI
jgi:hypothetical protein